jgi:hypothetical protein
VTTTKNNSAKKIGFTTFASAPPTFNQALLSSDKREGAKIPSNSNRVPATKIKHATRRIAPAANASEQRRKHQEILKHLSREHERRLTALGVNTA